MSSGPRILCADRKQLYWDMIDLDSQIEVDHLVRVIWSFVETLDLSALYDAIRARDEVAGRPTADPKVLLSLWLYAAAEGVGSARALERLCQAHAAYRWLCGGVPVNYHTLSDFRGGHGALLDRVLSESVASLAAAGLVSLEEIAVDGTKVKANAGRSSYRGQRGLERYRADAELRIARLKEELCGDPGVSERRRLARAKGAAEQVQARAEAARRKLEELQAERTERSKTHAQEEARKSEPKVSMTDPQARLMRFADGGTRPAYNVLLASAPEAQIIVGAQISERRNETGLASPLLDEFADRYGGRPKRLLVDTKFATRAEIVALSVHPEGATVVYSPVPAASRRATPESLRKRRWRHAREPAALRDWRQRMASLEGQLIYARRRLIETVNGHLKNHGLSRLMLRGAEKVRCEVLLGAIAHNLRRGQALRRLAAAAGAGP
ncbi:MAG: transposase [Gammaproteobacteria bacterium]